MALAQHYGNVKGRTGHLRKAIGFIEIEDRSEKGKLFVIVVGNKTQ